MPRNSVGLDIGASTIKIVELKKVGEKVQLIKAGMVGVPRDSSRQKDVLSKLPRGFRTRRKAVSVAVPGQSAYIRYIDLPALDTSRIKQMMEYGAKQQIPVPLEEVLWDYQRLPTRDSSKTSIVLVAAKSEAIERLLDNVEKFGIEPYAIDYGPLASYNALKHSGSLSRETSILIDFGAESTNLRPGGFLSRSHWVGASTSPQMPQRNKPSSPKHLKKERVPSKKSGSCYITHSCPLDCRHFPRIFCTGLQNDKKPHRSD